MTKMPAVFLLSECSFFSKCPSSVKEETHQKKSLCGEKNEDMLRIAESFNLCAICTQNPHRSMRRGHFDDLRLVEILQREHPPAVDLGGAGAMQPHSIKNSWFSKSGHHKQREWGLSREPLNRTGRCQVPLMIVQQVEKCACWSYFGSFFCVTISENP